MKFIVLTCKRSNHHVAVNMGNVTEIYPRLDGIGSVLYFNVLDDVVNTRANIHVAESLESILEMLED